MAKYSGKNTIAKYNQILSDLKNKIYKPVYLLMGEETYYIDKLSDFISANVLPESERSFNQTLIYGKDVENISSIADAARRYPMMSNYQVIIVREAQSIGTGTRATHKIEELEAYVKNPLKTTILVFCYMGKSVDKRTGFYKAITKTGEVLESVHLYDNEIAGWITNFVEDRNFDIEPAAAAILSDYLGLNLSKIANELEKLFVVLPNGRKKITTSDIEENIGISKDYNAFELCNAISARNALKAYQIVEHFAGNSSGYLMGSTISAMFLQFSKVLKYLYMRRQRMDNRQIVMELGINPYFIKDYEFAARNFNMAQLVKIISLLREYDMKSKGFGYVASNDGELLRELISKIFNT